MRPFTTRGPPADSGYPTDRDLHQMTDDGGPVGPDPARWADPVWRDNLGEWDTFADEVRMGFPDASRPEAGAVTVRRPPASDLPSVQDSFRVSRLTDDPGGQPGEPSRVAPWSSVRVEGDAAAVRTAHRSRGGEPLDP